MQFSRRAVLASGTGVIAGFSGCSHTVTDTPTENGETTDIPPRSPPEYSGYSGRLTFTAKSGFNDHTNTPAEHYDIVARQIGGNNAQIGGNNAGSVKSVGKFEIAGGTVNTDYPGGREDHYQVDELAALYAGAAVIVEDPDFEPIRTTTPDHLALQYARNNS